MRQIQGVRYMEIGTGRKTDRRKQIQRDRYRETYREADTIHGHRYREIDTDRYVEEKIDIYKQARTGREIQTDTQEERRRHAQREI